MMSWANLGENKINKEGFYLTLWNQDSCHGREYYRPLINIIVVNHDNDSFFYAYQSFWIGINPYADKRKDRYWEPDNYFYTAVPLDEIFYIKIPYHSHLYEYVKHNNNIDISFFISTEKRLKIFKRDKFKCVYCNDSPAINDNCQLVIDHIHPQSLGGSSNINNLQTLCFMCNCKKSNKEEDLDHDNE